VLRTNDYREYILRTAAGSTVRHTSPARIEQYRIRIPKELAQRSALAKVERLCDAQSSTRDALAALLVFRTSIFTEVFGGN